MEMYRSGLGSKKISETLNIPRGPIKSIIKKWKEYDTTTNLPREGRPPKLMDLARRPLIREATKRPKINLKELQSSTVEIGVSVRRTTLNRILHRAGIYRRVARKSHCLKKKISKHVVGDSPNMWKKVLWSDETKIELFGHQGNDMYGVNPTPLITPRTTSPQ